MLTIWCLTCPGGSFSCLLNAPSVRSRSNKDWFKERLSYIKLTITLANFTAFKCPRPAAPRARSCTTAGGGQPQPEPEPEPAAARNRSSSTNMQNNSNISANGGGRSRIQVARVSRGLAARLTAPTHRHFLLNYRPLFLEVVLLLSIPSWSVRLIHMTAAAVPRGPGSVPTLRQWVLDRDPCT